LRVFFVLTLLAACTWFAGDSATAASQTWTGMGSDNNWSTPGNWASGVAPSASDALIFTGLQDISPWNDYPANTPFNGVNFDATAGNFTLSGQNAINLAGNIVDNSLNAQSIGLNMALQGASTISLATIDSSLYFSGSMSGSGGVTVTGAGLLTLSAGTAISGTVTIKGGVLSVGNDSYLGATTNNIIIDGGAFRPSTTINPLRSITLGDATAGTSGTFDIPSGTGVYNGIIANATSGSDSLIKTGLGTLTLGGTNSYTGSTIINQGTLKLDFNQTAAPLTNIIKSNSTLVMGGSATSLGNANNSVANIIAAAATLNLSGRKAADSQTFNGLTVNPGYSFISVNSVKGGTMSVALGPITENGGIVNFTLVQSATVANTTATTTTANDSTGILGGWAVYNSTDYAANNGSGNIVAYTGYTPVSGAALLSSSASNVQVTSATAGAIGAAAAGQTLDIHTLSLAPSASTAATTVTNDPAGTLRLGANGGLAVFGGATSGGGTLTINGGTLTAGGPNNNAPGQLTIFNNQPTAITINSAITDNGSGQVNLAFGGIPANTTNTGVAILGGANSYSGGTVIPAGFVVGTNALAFGTGPVTVYNGGQAYLNLAAPAVVLNNFNISGNGPVGGAGGADNYGALRITNGTLAGTVTIVGDAGILSQGATSTVNITGQITGQGNLTLGNNVTYNISRPAELPVGTIILSNTNNNWSGNLVLTNQFFNNTYPNTLVTLQMGSANVIPHASGAGNVCMAASYYQDQTIGSPTFGDVYDSAVTLVFNGHSQTINGLVSLPSTDGNIYGGALTTISNSSPTPATLTLGAGNASATFAGDLMDGPGGGALGLTKIGGGTQILSGTNTFTGPINIQGGVLNLTGPNATTSPITVTGGQLLLSASGSVNSASGIILNGSGAKLLTISAVPGTASVNVTQGLIDGTGTLGAVSVASGTGNVVANGNGSTNALTIGSLSFAGSATVTVSDDGTQTDPGIVVAGTLSTSSAGKIAIGVLGTSWSTGTTYDLIRYGSLAGAGSSRFTRGPVTGLGPRQTAVLGASAGFITLTIMGDSPKWTGSDSSSWATGSTGPHGNWRLISEGTSTNFQANDSVTFDDTAAMGTVSISATNVSPSSVTFSNDTLPYTISSPGGYGIRSGYLTKGGAGTLTINTANSYVGGTTLNNGTLVVGNSAALGSAVSPLTVNGGVLDLHGFNPMTGNFGGAGGVIASNGGGAATLTVNIAAGSTYAGTLADNTDSLGGTLSLVKNGLGTLLLASPNSMSGLTTINTGAIQLGDANALQNSTVNVNASNGLTFSASNASTPNIGTFNIAGLTGSSNGGITLLDTTGTAGVTVSVGANNATTTYSGAISGSSTNSCLTKVGSGMLTLSGGPVSFAGLMSVSCGTLQFANHNTGIGGDTASVDAGALLWFNLTSSNPFGLGGLRYLSSLGGTGTAAVTAYSAGVNITSVDFDYSNFQGVLDLRPNPVSGDGSFRLDVGTVPPFPGAVVNIEKNTSLELEDPGQSYASSFQVSGTGTSAYPGALRLGGTYLGTAEEYGPITLLGNSSIGCSTTSTGIISGNISESGGSYSLATFGPGEISLSGSNTYSGGTIVSSGTLQLGSATALPAGPLTVNGTLDLSSYSASVTTLTGSGTIDTSAYNPTLALTVENGAFSGTIQNSAFGAVLALDVTGPGTLILSGSNTYGGGTFVTGGTLDILNPAALPDGSSLIVGDAANLLFAPAATALSPSLTARAVPEPGSWALLPMASGLLLLGWRTGRLRRMPSQRGG
jgi:fibronectin-binding autotransporter adhesin